MCLSLKECQKELTAVEDIVVYKRLKTSPYIISSIDIHGKEFTGIIRNEECKGRISFENNSFYFCTNNPELDGKNAIEKFGYMYSWVLDYRVKKIIVDDIIIIKDYMILPQYGKNMFKTPYQSCDVVMGETYESYLEKNGNSIGKGLHSFAALKHAKEDGDGVFAKCIIPKGSKYYTGTFDGAKSYASDTLTYLEIVK